MGDVPEAGGVVMLTLLDKFPGVRTLCSDGNDLVDKHCKQTTLKLEARK